MSWATFRQALNAVLNEQELRTLCFDLAIDYDSLRGQSKDDKVRELIALFQRNGRLPDLIARLEEIRPNVAWQTLIPDPSLPKTGTVSTSRRNLIIGAIIFLAVILIFGVLSWNRDKSSDELPQPTVVKNEAESNELVTENVNSESEQTSCLDDYFAEIDPERLSSIEVGERARDVDLVEEDRTSSQFSAPYGIQLTKNGTHIGALMFILRSDDVLFKILSVADKECQAVSGYRNVTRRSEDTLEDSDVLEMPLNGGIYTIRPNFQGTHIRYSFQEVVNGE